MTASFIPQTDPRASYLAHRDEIDAAIAAVLQGGTYILGQEVREFEREFGAYHAGAHAVGVANGTDALIIALRACGIGPGDAVVTVSHTSVATVAAIEQAAAIPIVADIKRGSYTIDCDSLEKGLASVDRASIKAIIPVHLYGQPADMPAVMELARRYGWMVIEDCAQSLGATLQGRRVGTWGNIAAFSFYPTKNLGAVGDGGAVVTSDVRLAERARMLREYGWQDRYVSEIAGFNSRLDELQAAILRVKLRHLDAANARRREIAARYAEALPRAGVTRSRGLRGRQARLAPVRDPAPEPGATARAAQGRRRGDARALSRAGAPAACLPRLDSAGGQSAGDGDRGPRSGEPSDVPRTDRRAGRPRDRGGSRESVGGRV